MALETPAPRQKKVTHLPTPICMLSKNTFDTRNRLVPAMQKVSGRGSKYMEQVKIKMFLM